jgi:hypothetical protein
MSKLSVDLPESLHTRLKQHCVGNKVTIKDWLIERIKEATGA